VKRHIFFHGNQENPYPYIKEADLLLITSFHEAAPLVIDEAMCLGIPVMSTRTTSADDMIASRKLGWVVGTTQADINNALLNVVKEKDVLFELKHDLLTRRYDNSLAVKSFDSILE
jgi:glycosyltransferase involved in cell wall biosynthesis